MGLGTMLKSRLRLVNTAFGSLCQEKYGARLLVSQGSRFVGCFCFLG
jgi:hypothetical protein